MLVALVAHVRPLAGGFDAAGPLESDAAEIRRIDSAWSRALQAKDLDAVMSNYADDAAFLAPGQPLLRGRRAIREWFERTTATPGYAATFAPTEIAVAASRDMAYEIGTYRVSFLGEDGVPVHRVGKHLVTWAKLDGRWRVTAESISGDRSSTLPMPTASTTWP